MGTLALHLESLEWDDPWHVEQKIFDLFNDYLQPTSMISASEAAKTIDGLTPMKRAWIPADGKEKESPESFMWEFWCHLIAIVKQIPHDHPSQDKMIQLWGERRIWTDLPILSPTFVEAIHAWIGPMDSDQLDRSVSEWINFNSFTARLLDAGLYQAYNFAVWALRDALEESTPAQDLWACQVRAAAEWIRQSGQALFDLLSDADLDEDHARRTAAGRLYKGKAGLCLERWQFWKERFGEVPRRGDVELGKWALEVVSRMEAIEQKVKAPV